MRRSVFLWMLILASAVGAQAQLTNTINTVAGGGTNAATAATAYLPGSFGVARDTTNHVTYLSIPALSVVYKVDAAGNITPYAGNGTLGFSGDGGAATSAQLNGPNGIAVDNGGNLFIADSANNRIRKVDTSGAITTVAGSGNQYNGVGFFGGYSGDGGPATSALMNFPTAVAVDGNGNLFIADASNNVIRKVDNSPSHVITTYAGNGTPGNAGTANGDGGAATLAQLNFPSGVAVDSTGDVFIGDSGDSVVRTVNTALPPIITTYAGSAANIFTFSGDGGPANLAGLNFPQGITLDSSNNLYIADTFNNRIRKVDGFPPHNISTLAGSAGICLVTTGCGDGAAAASAVLNTPSAVAIDAANGNVFLCDSGTQRYRMVVPGGAAPVIIAYAGGGSGGDGNAATSAILGNVPFVAVDAAGDLIVVDGAGARIRKVDAKTQVITDIAGNGIIGPPGLTNGDGGPAIQANLTQLNHGIAIGPSGDIYFIDRTNFIIRRIDTLGTITKVAGTYGARCAGANLPACGDGGPAASALLRAPTGIAVDSSENIYISDGGLNRIRVFTVGGNISNFAGTGVAGATNGPASMATFNAQWGIAFDVNNNLYVADTSNNLIRKIDNTALHNVTTLAFNGQPTFGGDGGSALSASMQFPQQVAVDAAGNVYVGGGIDNVVQRIDVNDQTVITVAGDVHNLDGGFRTSDDGGPSTNALLSNFGLAISKDTANNTNLLYIADEGNNRIRAVDLAPVAAVNSTIPASFGPVLPGDIGNAGLVTVTNNGLDDLTVTNASVPAGFSLSNSCFNPATQLPVPVSPVAGACLLDVAFTPPIGAANGMVFSGNLTFNTNDPANPSSSFALSGTVATTPETLTLNLSGGTGTITGTPEGLVNGAPALLLCTTATPPPCTFSFALGQQVTLIAVGSAGSAFTGWTVNGLATTCPGTTPTCTVTMSAAENVTATFGPASVTVSGMGNGSGTITSTPAGIDCVVTNGVAGGPTCTFSAFPAGTQSVTLTATAAAGGSTFAGWLGFCGLAGNNTLNSAGTGPCTIPFSIASVTALNGALATAVFSAPGPRLMQGQVFVGTVDGMIFVYNPDGTLSRVLNSGNLGGTITEMNFDIGGNLYAANPLATNTGPNPGTVEFFMNTGAGPSFDSGLFDSEPSGVLLAPSGNIFVSQSAGQNTLLEFTNVFNDSQPVNTFFPAFENGGVGFMELRDDGASVLYTSNSPSVKNFDILNNHQNPDFATNLPGGPAYALRELGDKSVLVANSTEIVRLSPTGSVVQVYKPGGGGLFFGLNLDPDGISFWTGDALSGKVYRVKIADGSIIGTPINTGLGFNAATFNFATIFGIAVLGQPASGGADLAVAVTAPVIDDINAQITFTATITNNGPLAAAGVSVTDTFPAGVTVNSAVSSQGLCTVAQTVTCNVGTMNNAAIVTVTIKVTPTAAMTLVNTVTANSTTLDPVPGNNSFTTSTTVLGPALATIALTAPGFIELGTSLTYTMTVTNPGGTTLAGISAQLSVPPVLGAPSSVSPGCSAITLICTIGTLTPGQVVVLELTFVPSGLTNLNTTATVTGGNNANVATVVINNGVPLVVEVDSVNSADFLTTNPSSGICTTGQGVCTAYFPPGTMVTVTANGPGFVGWSVNNASSPSCPPSLNTCSVTLSSPTLVLAAYTAIGFVPSQLTGVVGIPFGVDFSNGEIGGVTPYTITLTGTVPGGLTFTTPLLTGTPTVTGVTPLTVNVTDAIGDKGSTAVTLTIINAPTGQEALMNGNYGIVFHGVNDSDGSLFAAAGSLHFNGKGVIDSGTLDTNGNGAGQVPQTIAVTGTYTIGPDHRCLIKLQGAGLNQAVLACSVGDVYQGVAHTAYIINFDDNTGTGNRGAGMAKLQDPNAFTPASLAGTRIFGHTGQDTGFNRTTEVGVETLSATGTITALNADFNDNGVLSTLALVNGTYGTDGVNGAISPVGRTHVVANLTKTTNGVNQAITSNTAVYIVDPNTSFSLRIDSGATNGVFAGTAERQLNITPFDATFLSGPDVIAAQGPSNAGNGGNVLVGAGTFTAAAGPNPMTGTLALTKDSNDSGNVTLEGIENDPYTMAGSGRLVVTPSSGKPVFGYLSRPNRGYIMGTDASADFGTIDLQTGGPFTVPALPTDYFFGGREPTSNKRGEDISGVISLSNNSATATIDQAHEDGRLDYDFSATFGISLAPTGRLTLTHGPSNLLITNDEIGQVITPSHIIFSEFDPSENHPTLHEELAFLMPPGLPLPNPATVTFPVPVASGSNAMMTQVFTNASDGLLSFTGVDTSKSPDFNIDPSSTCVGPAAVIVIAHGTCNGVVTFAPLPGTPAGPVSETLTLLSDAGNVTITANGTVAGAAAATHFAVSAPALATAGTAFNVTVTAQDAANNTATGYAGIVHFTSTDGAATLPADTKLTNGVGTFPATLNTVGPQTITAKDTVTASITGISNTITVSAGAAQTVNVHLIDNGSGAVGTVVDNSVPQQINCTDTTGQLPGPACSTTYPDGTAVTFTATPGAGAAFVNWNGSNVACQAGTPANVCTVTVIGFTSLEANFTNGPGGPFTLTVAPPAGATGGGRVSSGVPSNSLNCTFTGTTTSGACTSVPLKSGTVTEAIPQADANSTFGGYAGSCPNQFGNNCFVPMSQNQTVTPVFNIIPITLNVAFVGNGTVTSDVGGINCSNPAVPANVCKTTVNSGTVVNLTETPGAGFAFGSWTPACASPTCTLTLNTTNEPTGSLTVTATFTALPTFTLTVTDNGTGSGTVKSQPGLIPSISCTTGTPDGCTGTYNQGQPVTLTATAAAGSTFAGWSGGTPACAGVGTCSVTMTQAQNVTATFNVNTGPTLVSIAVTPPNPTIKASATQQFTATGTFSDNSMQNLTASVTWASSDLTIATIGTGANTPGLAVPVGAGGTTKITATSGNIVGFTNLTVAVPVVITNWNVSGEGSDDKQRVDGKSSPLQIRLTNTSANLTVHVTGVSADNPAFTVTTDCTALGPGQSCNVLASFTTTSTCQNLSANITVVDDDPGGSPAISVNGFGADNGLQVDDMTNPAITALSLAQKLIGTGLTISNVTYTGAARAAGTFTSSSNIVGFSDGVVLSTGSVRNTVGPNCSPAISVDNGQPGDVDLNGLLGGGQTTNDAAVLEFDFVPASPSISFQYVFSSDEYNEFVGQFDDVFGFFLGPKGSALQNIALIPGTILPVSINNVNDGNPTANPPVPPSNPQFFINNDFQAPKVAPVDTEMDGLTVVFTAQAQVIPGNTYHIKLAIADASDFAVDSNVFIKAGSFTSSAITLSPASLAFGNQPVNSQSPTQPVTMTNTGATPVNIASIVASAPFVDPDNCPKQLAPSGQAGSSCTINVSFQPTSTGAFNGTLTVNDDAPVAGSIQTVALTGTGTAAGPTLVSIAVTPANQTLVIGQQQQYTATGTFSDNSQKDLTSSVTWTSTNGDVASIVNTPGVAGTGNATALSAGTTTITATDPPNVQVSGSTMLTVTNVPFMLTITPPPGGNPGAPPTLPPGGSVAIGLTLAAAPGPPVTVTLSCTSNQPQFLTCAPAPSTVTLSGNGPKQVAIVLNAFCSGVPTPVPGPQGPGGGLQLLLLAMMFGSIALAYRKRSRLALSFAVLMFMALGSAACSSVPTGPNGRTPAGNYTLFITASAGGKSQTVQLPIMVTP